MIPLDPVCRVRVAPSLWPWSRRQAKLRGLGTTAPGTPQRNLARPVWCGQPWRGRIVLSRVHDFCQHRPQRTRSTSCVSPPGGARHDAVEDW